MKRVLLVVNPIAGLGGPLAMKGTDEEVGRRLAAGVPRSQLPAFKRLDRFLDALRRMCSGVRILSAKYMGAEEAESKGFDVEIIYKPVEWPTRSIDTVRAVASGLERGAELVVFVGGDGTARLVYDAVKRVKSDAVILGVPAGVKMYSGVYAVRPEEAAQLVCNYLEGKSGVCEAEIVDVDEDAFRANRLVLRLYGVARVPCGPGLVGVSKQPSVSLDEEENKEAIARYILEEYVKPCTLIILGPGSTTATIAKIMGVEKTLLGVDVYHGNRVIALDVDEETLYRIVSSHPGKKLLIVSPIGGQGFILGRGNQQISPRVVRAVGLDNILVVATRRKMSTLGYRLRVDTGDPELDSMMRGYRRVVIDYGEEAIVKVE